MSKRHHRCQGHHRRATLKLRRKISDTIAFCRHDAPTAHDPHDCVLHAENKELQDGASAGEAPQVCAGRNSGGRATAEVEAAERIPVRDQVLYVKRESVCVNFND